MTDRPLDRRRFLGLAAAGATATAAGLLPAGPAAATTGRPGWSDPQGWAGGRPRRVFLGAYTEGPGAAPGIGLARVDPRSGALSLDGYHPAGTNPFYLTRHRHTLYAVNDTAAGTVRALRIAPDGGLCDLNVQPTGGAGPVHLRVHPSGRFLLSTNYDSGSVAVHRLRADGGIGELVDLVQHTGSGPHPTEQLSPHPHMAVTDPTGERVLVPDKGTDFVYVYRIDLRSGRLTQQHKVFLGAGVGPRHLVFHPSGRFLYVVDELASSVTTCGYRPATGALWTVEAVSIVPPGTDPRNAPSAIVLSPDARFVYAANRGLDAIAVLAVTAGGERLRLVGLQPVSAQPPGTELPWDLALDRSGRFLYAANRAGQSVVQFQVDRPTGMLAPTGAVLPTFSPVRILLG